MREILFKGKRSDNGEWVEGYFVKGRWYLEDRDILVIIPTDVCFYPHCEIGEYIEVYPETVCQYTGLTDKNGKKIFEGDVVVCKQCIGGNQIDYHCEIGYVEMKHGAFGIHREQGYYRPFKDWLEDYEYEVIGNIFDNPDLLTTSSTDSD